MIVNEQNFPERDSARGNSETSGTIFSSSFKVGIVIEMEFESVILKRQTFNAQPAFGKRTAVAGVNIQSSDSNNSQWSACQAVARDKNYLGSNDSPASGPRRDCSALQVVASGRLEPTTGFEPVTCGLRNRCSTS